MKKGYKICPHCGKEIKSVAIKCQHCLKFLDEEPEKKTKECPFCMNEIDINESKCPFCEETLKKESKIKKLFASKGEKEEKISEEDDVNKKGARNILRRIFIVLYFLITIPILCFIIGAIRENSEIHRSILFKDYYEAFFRIVVAIIGYVILTDLLRRLCSFIGNGNFKGFLNYKKIFLKHRIYILTLIIILIVLGFLYKFRENRVNNACTGEGEILHEDLSCTCEENYSLVGGKCEKSDFLKLDEAIVNYSDKEFGFRYYLDNILINDKEGLTLFVDTSVPGGSLPEEYEDDFEYGDPLATNVQTEGLSSAVGQGYIVAYEKKGNDYIINDLYKVPDYYGIRALPYPVLNSKMANYEMYGGPETHDEEDRYVLEYTKILKLRDIDGDGINNEFFLMNHIDDFAGVDNFLAIGYDSNLKKINQYYFKEPHSQHKTDRTTLDRGSQNKFENGTLYVEDNGSHGVECKENWTLKFNKDTMTFETIDYKVDKKCEYYAD